jgi:hypothetical protein
MFPREFQPINFEISIQYCDITGVAPILLTLNSNSTISLIQNLNISVSTYERLIGLSRQPNLPRIDVELPDTLSGIRQNLEFSNIIDYLYNHIHKEVSSDIKSLTDSRFKRWILKLGHFIVNNCKLLIDLIPDILQMIEEMSRNTEYYEIALEIMDGATSSCGDRIILSVLYLSVQYKMYTIKYDEDSIELIFETIMRGPFIMSILEEVARDKVKTLRFFDEIEVYLAYPIMLREKFKIPIATQGMLFYTISAINNDDLDYASKRVENMLRNTDAIEHFLFTQSLWTKMLYHLFPDEPIEENNYLSITRQLMDRYNLQTK